jgi:hypothetical protein
MDVIFYPRPEQGRTFFYAFMPASAVLFFPPENTVVEVGKDIVAPFQVG